MLSVKSIPLQRCLLCALDGVSLVWPYIFLPMLTDGFPMHTSSFHTASGGKTSKTSSAAPAPSCARTSRSGPTTARADTAPSSSLLPRTRVARLTCSTDTPGRHARSRYAQTGCAKTSRLQARDMVSLGWGASPWRLLQRRPQGPWVVLECTRRNSRGASRLPQYTHLPRLVRTGRGRRRGARSSRRLRHH